MPSFTDPAVFPSFEELPPSSSAPAPTTAPWFLLAQIKEDMTITKPTVIARDRTGAEFAVTFDDGDHLGLVPTPTPTSNSNSSPTPNSNSDSNSNPKPGERLRFRKNHTLVVPRATRTDRGGEGKKPVVRVPAGGSGGVRVVPGPLDQVLELGVMLAVAEETGGVGRKCAACGGLGEGEGEGEGGREGEEKEKGKGRLMRCTGCGVAAYCSKECQVRAWSELGHKANCKVLRCIREIWP